MRLPEYSFIVVVLKGGQRAQAPMNSWLLLLHTGAFVQRWLPAEGAGDASQCSLPLRAPGCPWKDCKAPWLARNLHDAVQRAPHRKGRVAYSVGLLLALVLCHPQKTVQKPVAARPH